MFAQASRSARWVFFGCAAVVMVLSLLPVETQLPSTGWDKANHLLAFSVLAILGCWSYPARKLQILACLLAYGGLIELLQALTPYRFAEWGDLLADALGLVCGWAMLRGALAAGARLRA